MAKRNVWMSEQDAYICDHWQVLNDEEIAKSICRTFAAVRKRLHDLGLSVWQRYLTGGDSNATHKNT